MEDRSKHGFMDDDTRERPTQEAQATPTKDAAPAKVPPAAKNTTRKSRKTTKRADESETTADKGPTKADEGRVDQIAAQPTARRKSVSRKAASQKPTSQEIVAQQPVAQPPASQQSVPQQAAQQQPIPRAAAAQQQPRLQQPTLQQPVAQEAVAQEAVSRQTASPQRSPQQTSPEEAAPQPSRSEQPAAQQSDAAVERVIYDETSETAPHTGNGGTALETEWEAAFVEPIRKVILAADDSGRDMRLLHDAISRLSDTATSPRSAGASSTGAADRTLRILQEIWPTDVANWSSRKRATLGAALVLTAPAIPALAEAQGFIDEEWLRGQGPAGWGMTNATAGIRRMYEDLLRLRRNASENTRGLQGQQVKVHHVNDWDKVIAFHRWERGGPGDDVIVVVNAANRAYVSYNIGLPQGGFWRVRFNSDWEGYSPDFGNHFSYDTTAVPGARDGFAFNGNVGLGPYSVVILSQDE